MNGTPGKVVNLEFDSFIINAGIASLPRYSDFVIGDIQTPACNMSVMSVGAAIWEDLGTCDISRPLKYSIARVSDVYDFYPAEH